MGTLPLVSSAPVGFLQCSFRINRSLLGWNILEEMLFQFPQGRCIEQKSKMAALQPGPMTQGGILGLSGQAC